MAVSQAGPSLLLLLVLPFLCDITAARQLNSAAQTGKNDPALGPGVSWLFALDPWNSASFGNSQRSDALSSWLVAGPRVSGLVGGHASNSTTGEGGQRRLLPLDRRDYVLLAVLFVSLALAGGAGIGGGAILVPSLILIENFSTETAVALSNLTILGGAAANFICNVRRRRPNGKPVIDWDLIMMMEPTTIVGALVGGYLNKFLPTWITTILLTVMLFLMAARLFTKGRQTYEIETKLICKLRTRTKGHETAAPASAAGVQAAGGTDDALTQPLLVQDEDEGDQDAATNAAYGEQQAVALTVTQQPQPSESAPLPVPRAVRVLRTAAATGGGSGSPRTASPAVFEGSGPSPRVGSGLLPRGTPTGSKRRFGRLHSITRNEAKGSYTRVQAMQLFQGEAMEVQEAVVAVVDISSSEESDTDDTNRPAAPAAAAASSAAADDAANDVAGRALGAASGADQDSPNLVVKVDILNGTPKSAKGHSDTTSATAPPPQSSHTPQHGATLPVWHLLGLLMLSAWVVASDFGKAALRCGTPLYWLVTASLLVPVSAVLLGFRAYLLRKHAGHAFNPEEGELHWTPKTTLLYPALCTFAGLVAGLFGVGGGIVKGPLMLELGVLPEVAAATSATMIAFTAASACVVYARFGGILWDYGSMLVVVGFTVTLLSQLVTFHLVRLLGRRSIIIFLMVGLMGLATVIMVWEDAALVPELAAHPEELWHFGSICPRPKHP